MSQFSGKCDLFDHISMEKMYDRGRCLVSDELECFKIFKQRTGGKIYQHQKIVVSEWNQEFVKSKSVGNFDYKKCTRVIPDKRLKNGERVETYYTYIYWDKEYADLKALNKHGVYITEEITFETLLDIIPYYPYVVTSSSSSPDGEYIVIATEPSYLTEYKQSLKNGGKLSYPQCYIQELSRHYQEVINTYYNYKLEERIEQITLLGYKPLHNGYYELLLPYPADTLHEVKFVWADGTTHSHWTSPKLEDKHTVLISEDDIDIYLSDAIRRNEVFLEYVKECPLLNTATNTFEID